MPWKKDEDKAREALKKGGRRYSNKDEDKPPGTFRNSVLPKAPPLPAIPPRVGVGRPIDGRTEHDASNPEHRAKLVKLVADAELRGIQKGEEQAHSLRQSEIASRPRKRLPDPGVGLGFAKAVKKESRKTRADKAWLWIGEDATVHADVRSTFDGFFIKSWDEKSVKYSYQLGRLRTIKRSTFDRYFNSKLIKT